MYLDSYDETKLKSNLVVKYLSKLGNKFEDKVIITCRTGYICKDEMDNLFMPRGRSYEKAYIAKVNQ